MSTTVWKYDIPYDVEFRLDLPAGAEILAVATQHQGNPVEEGPVLWALVDPEAATVTRHFRLVATGGNREAPADARGYLGTVQLVGGSLVFHIFETGSIR